MGPEQPPQGARDLAAGGADVELGAGLVRPGDGPLHHRVTQPPSPQQQVEVERPSPLGDAVGEGKRRILAECLGAALGVGEADAEQDARGGVEHPREDAPAERLGLGDVAAADPPRADDDVVPVQVLDEAQERGGRRGKVGVREQDHRRPRRPEALEDRAALPDPLRKVEHAQSRDVRLEATSDLRRGIRAAIGDNDDLVASRVRRVERTGVGGDGPGQPGGLIVGRNDEGDEHADIA